MRRLPWSLSLFGLTAIIFVLQLIPLTGIFLMLLLAPLWSVVTVNLGFVALGLEAAVGRVSRLWLIAPALWFGGYALAAQASERAVAQLQAEIRSGNAGRSLRFDPDGASLVVASSASDLGQAAQQLVDAYRLSVAYTEQVTSSRRRRDKELDEIGPAHRAQRIADARVCQRIRTDQRFRAARVWGSVGVGKRGQAVKPVVCQLSMPDDPELQVYRIAATAERLSSFLLEGRLVKITITAPDGTQVALRSGHAAALGRWPMPAIGCGLNSGKPSWDCDAAFMRRSYQGLGGDGAYGGASVAVIAKALGLEPQPAHDRLHPSVSAETEEALKRVLLRHEGAALANLDRLLADPTLRATVHDLAGLTEMPEELASRAGAMLEAMSAALAHGKGRSESARNLQRLVAALPEAEFRRLGDDLVARLEKERPAAYPGARRPVQEEIDANLATRLGDLGPVALPLLERNAFTRRAEYSTPALLGLCRMGAPAAHLADRVAEQGSSTKRPFDNARLAAYVTLMRWNRADLAHSLIDPETNGQRQAIERRWPGLAEGAGPEFCALHMQR